MDGQPDHFGGRAAIAADRGALVEEALQQPDRLEELEAVRFLVEEVGLSEAEAADLVRLLGTDLPSLLREAKVIKKARG